MQNNGLKSFVYIVLVVGIITTGILLIRAGSKTENKDEKNNDTVATTESNSTIGESGAKETDYILFYGNTCPHCKKVDEFIAEKNIAKYLKFQHLEVYDNRMNAELMMKKQDECKNLSDDDKGGVPFLYSSEKCVVGDTPIINFLSEKAGI